MTKKRRFSLQWDTTSTFQKITYITFIVSIQIIFVITILYFHYFINPNSSYNNNSWTELPLDVDRLPNGDTLVTSSPITVSGRFATNPKIADIYREMNQLYLVDSNGTIKWRQTGFAFPHEVEYIQYQGNYYYFIADTQNNSAKMFDTDFNLIWEFKPELINWTKVNSEWGADSYYNNPIDYGWTHLNDLDFIFGSDHNTTYDSILISINRFDMVLLLNFTAEYEEHIVGDDFGSVENIYWWYGPGEIHLQHNPDMLPNGNVIICDSLNGRIIEVNTTTNEIVHTIDSAGDKSLVVVKDADYNPINGNYLITDSGNNRIVIIDDTGELLWEWKRDLAIPYEADWLENGNILISGATSGAILEVSIASSEVVWSYYANAGKDFYIITARTVCIFIIILSCLSFTNRLLINLKLRKSEESFSKWQWVRLSLSLILIFAFLFLTIFARRIVYSVTFVVIVTLQKRRGII